MPTLRANGVLSLAAGTVLDAAPADIIGAAAAAGFDGCGLRLDPAQTPRSMLPIVRSRLDDLGISLLDLEVIRMLPGRPAEDHRPLLEMAAELGAGWTLTVLEIPDPGEQVDRLARLHEMAVEFGVQISLEFMKFTAVRTLADALALTATLPRCRIVVDALHLARSGGSPQDVAPHLAALSYVQLCDAPARAPGDSSAAMLADEARHHRLLPGDGELDLAGLIAVVPSDLPLSVEVQSDQMTAAMTPRDRAVVAYAAARTVLG